MPGNTKAGSDLDAGKLREANESLTRELLNAYEELDLLHTLSSIFVTSADVDEMGERLVAEAVEALTATAGFLVFTGDGMEEFDAVIKGAGSDEVQSFVRVIGPQILGGESVILDHALAEGWEPRPLLAVPLRGRDGILGALGLFRASGEAPFTAGDERTLGVLSAQAAAVILQKRNLDLTFLSESLKQFNEGLRTLLEISRELTGALDVDRVLSALVNLPGRVVAYDRASIALREGGRWRLRAVSGLPKIDRNDDELMALESILAWVGERGEAVRVETDAEGTLAGAPAEVLERFRDYFGGSDMRAFFSLLLADDEGRLGILAVERGSGVCPSERAGELLHVLANQATVALRNAQLYQQVPLIGVIEPVLRTRKRYAELPFGRQVIWAAIAVALPLSLILIPAPLRLGGRVSLVPVRTLQVSAVVAGRIAEVPVQDGATLKPGQIVARLDDREYRLRRAEVEAEAEISDRRVRQLELSENPRAAALERSRRDRLFAELALADAALQETVLRAPEEGVILTPRVRELTGQRLEVGDVFCTMALLDPLEAEVSVAEADLPFLEEGQRAELKLNAFPDRVFLGEVRAVRPVAESRDGRTVVVARVLLDNDGGILKPGMQGRGRIRAGRIQFGWFLLRRPARWVRQWFWF